MYFLLLSLTTKRSEFSYEYDAVSGQQTLNIIVYAYGYIFKSGYIHISDFFLSHFIVCLTLLICTHCTVITHNVNFIVNKKKNFPPTFY